MDFLWTWSLWSAVVAAAVCFVLGELTRNYSHVDRLWSVLPPLWAGWWMTAYAGDVRYAIAAFFVVVWGGRLTANFAMKGGYRFSWKKGGFYEEDYRWKVLKQRIPNRLWFALFNLLFISGFQVALIFAFTSPLYFLGQVEAPLDWRDYTLFALHALFLVGETAADWQQWTYYQARRRNPSPRAALGFNTYGLWKWSRHPNYVCEMGQWWVVAAYLLVHRGWHPSAVGAIALTVLFVGSTRMAESITASKYPAYADWRRAVPMWLGWPRRAARRAFVDKWGVDPWR